MHSLLYLEIIYMCVHFHSIRILIVYYTSLRYKKIQITNIGFLEMTIFEMYK